MPCISISCMNPPEIHSLPYIEIHNPMLELINLYPSQYAHAQPLILYASSISYEILYARYGEIHNLYRSPEIRRNLNRNIGPGIIPPKTVGGGELERREFGI